MKKCLIKFINSKSPKDRHDLEQIIRNCDDFQTVSDVSIQQLQTTIKSILELCKIRQHNRLTEDQVTELMNKQNEGLNNLYSFIMNYSGKDERKASVLQFLFSILPYQRNCLPKRPFPNQLLKDILKSVIKSKTDINTLNVILKEYLSYVDFSNNLWNALLNICLDDEIETDEIHNILLIIRLQNKPNETLKPKNQENQYLCNLIKIEKPEKIGLVIEQLWEVLATKNMSGRTKQLLLLTLNEQFISRMNNPIFLTDYLMHAMDSDGPVALLALQGIYTLIQKHNIEYPNIYKKLYFMFDPKIFNVQYKHRFYYLSDIFLSSTHLQENLIASFVKRLARISLVAPPEDILIILCFITRLLIRHPGLKKLINKPEGETVTEDPYDMLESDPAISGANNSSLWEIKLLQGHALPSVATAACFINNNLPNIESDMCTLLDQDSGTIFKKEIKKKMNNPPPLTFERPDSMSLPGDDGKALSFWDFG